MSGSTFWNARAGIPVRRGEHVIVALFTNATLANVSHGGMPNASVLEAACPKEPPTRENVRAWCGSVLAAGMFIDGVAVYFDGSPFDFFAVSRH